MTPMTEDNYDTIDMASVADSALEDIQPGMIVKGEIVTVDSGYAYVNVGTKSDGRVPLEEFDTVPKVGEVYEVKLMNRKLVDGVYQFSRKAAVAEKSWKDFIESYNKGNREVKGKIKSSNDKGKILSLSGVNAFLPASLAADLKSVSSSDEEYFFVVKDVDKKKKSVLVSRKDYIEELNKKKWEDFLSKYKEGDIVKGEVVKFVEFGAFVRIDGIDALLHRNDMSWKKVFKQRKILKLGEVRDFVILSINRDELKVSLGLKQLKEDPWLAIAQKFNPGDIVKGKVVTITPVGAFVQIDEDIEGFVANSELSWTKSNANVKDYFSKGDESDFVILSIEPQDKKIALGFKQLSQNPWETIDERFPIDSIWKRPIKKIVKFGLFVELEEGIDGLIHVSDISWDEVKDLNKSFKVGQEVEFKILEIHKDEMKISCGMKQLTKSPWELIKEKYPPRTKVHGTVSGITQFGLFVKLADDVEGLVHISETSRNRIEKLEEHFKIGDPVDAVVLDVDVEKKRLSLSIKHYEIMSEKEEVNKILKKTSPNTVTIGDIINIELGDKK
ncbi:MAG: 30S ribosomal protein S1 [Spirochaetes bacterium ADurb.Bin218]|nr:S1 RNA-binding domain-containing protein [Spirochaetota bacterium]OQA96897.1 MAG: 30S ribosomal protein S1 [Spirochaetes bacterium ADurb.Bin218]HOV08752.1 S1 RNA-binding domain-containing protein [Spirochaetota bacterium]